MQVVQYARILKLIDLIKDHNDAFTVILLQPLYRGNKMSASGLDPEGEADNALTYQQ